MICTFILLFLGAIRKFNDKMEAYIYSTLTWMLLCFSITEVLSLVHGIACFNLWLVWGTIDILLLLLVIVKRKELCHFKIIYQNFINLFHKGYICLFAVYSLIMLLLAVKMVPYNWDSMTYHCSRLFHWMQNQSVAHYATNIDRQVSSPILGAFVNLNVYVMSNGSDRMLNLLQCTSYLTNGVLVYQIAKKLRCEEKSCIIASVLFFTMPIAFAEALTTQVDNFSTLWLLSFVYLLLDFLDFSEKLVFQKYTLFKAFSLGLCIAFGYLSKPSIGFAMVVFALWLLIVSIGRKDGIVIVLKMIVCVVPAMIVIVVPEFLRNIFTFQALSAPGVGKRQLIGSLHERYIIVNLFKNFSFNFPNAWFYNSSEIIRKSVIRIAELLEIDINNPVISEDGREFMVHAAQTYGCDTAVNPLIVILLLLSIICFLGSFKLKKLKDERIGYYIASVASFLVFCAALKWEPFVSRYMLSYLALLCPAVVIVIEEFLERKNSSIKMIIYSIVCFLCATELIGLFLYHGELAWNNSRELGEGYFANRREKYESYEEITDYINSENVESIGLWIGGDSYEYPLTQMINEEVVIEHINVSNQTAIYEKENFVPKLIFTSDMGVQEQIVYCNNIYNLVKSCNSEALYMKANY